MGAGVMREARREIEAMRDGCLRLADMDTRMSAPLVSLDVALTRTLTALDVALPRTPTEGRRPTAVGRCRPARTQTNMPSVLARISIF